MTQQNRRCRCSTTRTEVRWSVALLAATLACAALPVRAQDGGFIEDTTPAAPGDEELFLDVVLNQTRTGRIARFLRREGVLHASAGTLRALGFALPGHDDPADIVPLQSLPGLVLRYDEALQGIELTAPLALLALATTRVGTAQAASATASADPGLLLNYDLYASHQRDASNITAASELRAFGFGGGVFVNTAVTRGYRQRDGSGEADGGHWRGESVRLDSRWTWSFPERAITATVGDAVSGFLPWSRAVRIGGIQIARNYALQPYRITTPLPRFLGEAVLPSSVELYVDGIRQYSGNVPAGPFQLSTVPGIDGAGNARLVVTDAYGAVRTLDIPFYATQQLLADGLSDWSLSAGVIREDYGLRSFSYASDPVASGQWRHGVSDRFTAELRGEAGEDLRNAGVGGAMLLGAAGVLTGSHARSRQRGASGSQSALGYRWSNGRFQLALDSQRSHGSYRDLATLAGAPPPRVSERALGGVVLPRFGNLSASWLRLAYRDGEDSRYAGVFWSSSFSQRWSAYASINQNLDDSDDRSAYIGLSIALDGRRQLGTSWQRNAGRDDVVMDLSRPVPGDDDDGGLGWRLQARGGDSGRGGLAEVAGFNDVGRYAAGIAGFDGNDYAYASASGSAVWMGGHAYATRNIADAFALVSTAGYPDIPVRLENRVIGHTDADGRLLVAPLLAWQHNRLSIDPMDLPADVRIGNVEQLATPRERSGTHVRFAIAPVRAALVVLQDANGRALPLGSRVRAGAEDAYVGYDGEVYLDTLELRQRLRVDTPQGVCAVDLVYPDGADSIPRIGPLRCLPERAL